MPDNFSSLYGTLIGNLMNKTIGRNDLCECGSGKKFKKCCLDKLISIAIAKKEQEKALLQKERIEDDVFGKQLIQYLEEEQKKQSWNNPMESLPVID